MKILRTMSTKQTKIKGKLGKENTRYLLSAKVETFEDIAQDIGSAWEFKVSFKWFSQVCI